MRTVNLKERRWFTTGQVGRLIEVTDDTIARWIAQGHIRASRSPGGWYKIDRDELVAFLKKFEYPVDLERIGGRKI